MAWLPHTALLLVLLVSSSTLAQDELEQTTLGAVTEGDLSDAQGAVDVRNEDSGVQPPSPEPGLVASSQVISTDDAEIAGLNREDADEKDEPEKSSDAAMQIDKPSAVQGENGVAAVDSEASGTTANTTPSELVVADENSEDANSNVERSSDSRDEISAPNEGQQDEKLSLQEEGDLEQPGSVKAPEQNAVLEPGSAQPEKVDYTSWRVYRVEGFGSSRSAPLQAGGPAPDDFDVLMELEETPHVRVLHENQLSNYFEIAISPEAEKRADVISRLEVRGYTLQDTLVDLGQLIADAEDGVFRSGLPKGAVSFDSYMTYEQIEDFITEFANLHPQIVTKTEIGKTTEGRSIHMLTLTLGPGSAHTRQRRQVTTQPPYAAIDTTLEALERIISWSDDQGQEEDVPEAYETETRKQNTQKLLERANGSRRSEDGPPPGFLEHMMYNMPYEVINDDGPFSAVGSDTYSTLNKIINITQIDDDDYPLIDFVSEPPEVQVAYKVLQKIMNYDRDAQTRKFIDNPQDIEDIAVAANPQDIEDIAVAANRIAKSLDTEATTLKNEGSEPIDVDEEAEILFMLTSIIPSEYADNTTMIDSIADSVRIIMKNVPRGMPLTDEVVQRIAPQIVQIPGVVGVASDSTNSKADLVSKLNKILRTRNTQLSSNKSDQLLSNQADAEQTLKTSSNKPVIFIDGGIHAREWISPAFVLYAATQLVDSTQLLLGAEWQLVPVLNPDGYVHTWNKDRMWRKSRGRGPQWCRGVDLNRNFGYRHGGKGSSGNFCSEIYRGPHAFSEPESQAVKTAVEAVQDRLQAYVTVHSYGQMILHPWGYDDEVHPDTDKMKNMGEGMSAAMRAVNGEQYVVGNAAAVLYPAAGGSDDWVSSLGVPYSFTLELRDTGSKGFILPASQILPTVKETWEGIRYLGLRVIEETPRPHAAAAPSALSQTGLDMLSALQGVGITSGPTDPVLQTFPSLVPVDQDAPNRFRIGIPDVIESPSSTAFPVAPLIPIFGVGPTKLNLDGSRRHSITGVSPNAHFKQTSNVGLPSNDNAPQLHHGVVLLESDPASTSGPALLSHFAQPAFQNIGFQYNAQQKPVNYYREQTQEEGKFRDALPEHEPAPTPVLSPYPFFPQNFPQYNIPYPALLPVPQFLPGIHAESQFGGSAVPYNSPMLIKPSFFDPEIQDDKTAFRYQPSTVGSQAQVSKYSTHETLDQPFNPSLRISEQPFRPILQPLPLSPAQANFKTNIHAVTASDLPEAEPKFAHPFLDAPNILVSLGSPHRPDPNAFRYEVPQNGHYSIIAYPSAIRRRGVPIRK